MGNACTCYLSYKSLDIFKQEFKRKPTNSTLLGNSSSDEPFIHFNTTFHNTNFSAKIQTSKPEKAFLKVPYSASVKIQVWPNRSPTKSFQEDIIFESELEKYKPDSSALYTPKWCRLTAVSFSYYKKKWSSLQSPLYYLPLSLISCFKVVKNRIQKNNPELFEFELILVDGEEGSGKRSKNTTREVSVISAGIFEEVLVGEKKLVFGTKDLSVFLDWVRNLEAIIQSR